MANDKASYICHVDCLHIQAHRKLFFVYLYILLSSFLSLFDVCAVAGGNGSRDFSPSLTYRESMKCSIQSSNVHSHQPVLCLEAGTKRWSHFLCKYLYRQELRRRLFKRVFTVNYTIYTGVHILTQRLCESLPATAKVIIMDSYFILHVYTEGCCHQPVKQYSSLSDSFPTITHAKQLINH